MKVIYTATATGGRQGTAKSQDGTLALVLARPKEMGGPGGGTSPEQLFVVGYAACSPARWTTSPGSGGSTSARPR